MHDSHIHERYYSHLYMIHEKTKVGAGEATTPACLYDLTPRHEEKQAGLQLQGSHRAALRYKLSLKGKHGSYYIPIDICRPALAF